MSSEQGDSMAALEVDVERVRSDVNLVKAQAVNEVELYMVRIVRGTLGAKIRPAHSVT